MVYAEHFVEQKTTRTSNARERAYSKEEGTFVDEMLIIRAVDSEPGMNRPSCLRRGSLVVTRLTPRFVIQPEAK